MTIETISEEVQRHLRKITTSDLLTELCKREGVRSFTTEPFVRYCIEDETGAYENDMGPVLVLVVRQS